MQKCFLESKFGPFGRRRWRRLRLCRLKFVWEQLFFAAAAQNIQLLVPQPTDKTGPKNYCLVELREEDSEGQASSRENLKSIYFTLTRFAAITTRSALQECCLLA